jgi:hypothetical protein
MSGPAEIEACYERLHRAGWSIGEVGTSSGWLVTGSNKRRQDQVKPTLDFDLKSKGP